MENESILYIFHYPFSVLKFLFRKFVFVVELTSPFSDACNFFFKNRKHFPKPVDNVMYGYV